MKFDLKEFYFYKISDFTACYDLANSVFMFIYTSRYRWMFFLDSIFLSISNFYSFFESSICF